MRRLALLLGAGLLAYLWASRPKDFDIWEDIEKDWY